MNWGCAGGAASPQCDPGQDKTLRDILLRSPQSVWAGSFQGGWTGKGFSCTGVFLPLGLRDVGVKMKANLLDKIWLWAELPFFI